MVEQLQIYRDASELIKRVFIIVKQFPRDYKFTIGTRIQNTSLDCIDLINPQTPMFSASWVKD
jgi:hypothetical protein